MRRFPVFLLFVGVVALFLIDHMPLMVDGSQSESNSTYSRADRPVIAERYRYTREDRERLLREDQERQKMMMEQANHEFKNKMKFAVTAFSLIFGFIIALVSKPESNDRNRAYGLMGSAIG